MKLTRRDFVQSAAVTGMWLAASKSGMVEQAAGMPIVPASAAKDADVIMNRQVNLEMLKDVPKIPSTSPPDWQFLAKRVNNFLTNPANGALKTDAQGVKYFRTVVEEEGRELITLGCVVAGKILRGDDVREFTPALGAFYNREYGLFLNNIGQRGIEYWYLMDLTALAGAIIRLALSRDAAILEMWENSVNRIMRMARQIGYDFNAQGYQFDKGTPFTGDPTYRQPDAIAGYAYVMLLAYGLLKKQEYMDEAVNALTRYQAFETNPWYEIPSGAMGVLAAARLNALGHSFDLRKMLEWVFDHKCGAMHVGRWGEYEMNGLMIGWRGWTREQARGVAFSMETMIVLPYVLPVVRYDPRFARAIGKYAVNVITNAKRFFSDYVPKAAQSRPEADPAIPYERLCSSHVGHPLFADGDFAGHKSVYGGGFALWWGAIIDTTEHEFIFRLDAAKTDFLTSVKYPTYLYYNPYVIAKTVAIDVGTAPRDLYDSVKGDFILKGAIGKTVIPIPADSAIVLVLVPTGGTISHDGHSLLVNGTVIDYR